MKQRPIRSLAALLLAGCHSDAFVTPPIPPLGPFSAGPDVQLTFNVDQNYWPTWTQDGRGILYAYVDQQFPKHRCLGLLPAAGGRRLWQLCDNRLARTDTSSSYTAYALDSLGHLLFTEAVSSTKDGTDPVPSTTLWLADTATPFMRTPLLTLPVVVGNTTVSWLGDIQWTGPSTFLALGQQFETLAHCITVGRPGHPLTSCPTRDTIFADVGLVVSGAITGRGATLRPIVGTDSATSYSLAENGIWLVFTRHHDLHLFEIPATGGIPVPMPIRRVVPDTDSLVISELAGVSCKGSICIVAHDGVFLTDQYTGTCSDGICCSGGPCEEFAHFFFQPDTMFPQSTPTRPMELHRISLTSGADEILQSNLSNTVFATPEISPVSGDVVVQVGGGWGHLQTFATRGLPDLFATDGNSVLHLYKGLVP